jgi:hypothetical protein
MSKILFLFACLIIFTISTISLQSQVLAEEENQEISLPDYNLLLDNSPLRSDELLNEENYKKIKSFSNVDFDVNHLGQNKWLFYNINIDDEESTLFIRLLYRLIEDPNVFRMVGYGGIIAFETNEHFSAEWLENNLRNLKVNFKSETKQNFLEKAMK